MKDIILAQSLDRIRKIHLLSRQLNGPSKNEHRRKLLELIDKHAVEVRELLEAGDPHGVVEVGDLAVLCFEVMLEEGVEINDVLEKCFGRYEKKLATLLNEK